MKGKGKNQPQRKGKEIAQYKYSQVIVAIPEKFPQGPADINLTTHIIIQCIPTPPKPDIINNSPSRQEIFFLTALSGSSIKGMRFKGNVRESIKLTEGGYIPSERRKDG